MFRRYWIAGIALGAVALAGCHHNCRKACPTPCPTGCPAPFGGAVPAAPPPAGPPGTPFLGAPAPANIPPANVPPAYYPPSGYGPRTPEILLPQQPPQQRSAAFLAPPPPGVRLGTPGVVTPVQPPSNPMPLMPPAASPEAKKLPPGPPPVVSEEPTPAFPVGIPDFAPVGKGITGGLKPNLEGLDWLQKSGYRTVLFLRRPGEDDAGDRKQVEKRGMTYRSIVVTPEALNAALVNEFSDVVRNTAGHPLFVYDTNGVLAGSMWYLYFRTAENLNDDEARVRAGRLGLKDKGTDEQQTMWVAIQQYLATKK